MKNVKNAIEIESYSDDAENYELEDGVTDAELEVHEAASLFPDMGKNEFEALKQDIAKNGLRLPILVFRNRIVDGRQRLRACRELGIAPRFQAVHEMQKSVPEYIISMNLQRRHLSDSQRAMVASSFAKLGKGTNQHTAHAVTQKEAADLLKVSVDSVQRARQVEANGIPELVHAVENGNLDVTNASTISSLSQVEQTDLLQLDSKAILAKAKQIRKDAMEGRRQQRIEAIAKKRANNKPLIAKDGAYSVIYADPAWDYISEETLGYPTMPLDHIKALPVNQIAAEDAVLFLWCSASLIGNALQVIESWGFKYKTNAVWDKQRSGQGVYFRIQHEMLLIATRGTVPEVPYSARPSSVFSDYSGEPSEKPTRIRSVIDDMYPELPKIELFCRGEPAKGWAAWGNECVDHLENQPKPGSSPVPDHQDPLFTECAVENSEAANDSDAFIKSAMSA
jgi:N6-adenosine-specific RNA methylase IME4/ParB-like chromosome segregation protein Spo0J